MGETGIRPSRRFVEQDVAKGLAILFVIFIHSAEIQSSTMDVILAFTGYAMPFFFLISGYYHKPGRRTWGQNVKRRIRQLLWPLFYYSVAIYIVMYAFFALRGEASLTDALSSFAAFWLTKPIDLFLGLDVGPQNPFAQIMGPGWFIQYMIAGCLVFYLFADYALRDLRRFISVNVALVAATTGIICLVPRLPWGLHAAPLVASLTLFGASFRQNKLFEEGTVPAKWNIVNSACAIGIYVVFMLVYPRSGTFVSATLGTELIGAWDVPFTLVAGILGTYFLVNLCKSIAQARILSDGLSWCGRNSLTIMLVHVPIITVLQKNLGLTAKPLSAQVEQTDPVSLLVFLLATALTVLLVLAIKRLSSSRR